MTVPAVFTSVYGKVGRQGLRTGEMESQIPSSSEMSQGMIEAVWMLTKSLKMHMFTPLVATITSGGE